MNDTVKVEVFLKTTKKGFKVVSGDTEGSRLLLLEFSEDGRMWVAGSPILIAGEMPDEEPIVREDLVGVDG